MSLRNILNHPQSPAATGSNIISPPSPSSSNLPPAKRVQSVAQIMQTAEKQQGSSSSRAAGPPPKRYLDRILDSDAFDDLQADFLPTMTQHPYPEPEGYASSDDMDLDDFAEIWSEPLNKYMVSSRRKEQLLEKGYDEWESSKSQDIAARITCWAGERAELAHKLKRARQEQRRRQEEERLQQEKLRALEEAGRLEREAAEEDKKRRKKELANAAKERNREKRRQAKEEAHRRKEEEVLQKRQQQAHNKALIIRAQAQELEAAREARLREEAALAHAHHLEPAYAEVDRSQVRSHRIRESQSTDWKQLDIGWQTLHDVDNSYPSNTWDRHPQQESHQDYVPQGYPEDGRAMPPPSEEPETVETISKSRVPSNLANLLNSPRGTPTSLGHRNPPRGPRSSQRNVTTGSIGKRKRANPESNPSYPPLDKIPPPQPLNEPQSGEPSIYSRPLSSHPATSLGQTASESHTYPTRRSVSGHPLHTTTATSQVNGYVDTSPEELDASSRSRIVQESQDPAAPTRAGPSVNYQPRPLQPIVDVAVRRVQNRSQPAWGHNLPYGTEPYENLPDELDMSLPVRDRAIANPKVLANKRWDAIEEARRQVWLGIARKDIPRVNKVQQSASQSRTVYCKRLSALVSREARRILTRTKAPKEVQIKAKRLMRELLVYYRGNEKRERDIKRKADKEAIERAKKDDEMREVKRQARKLNFLITQTELYSHFVGSKIKTKEAEESADTAGAVLACATNDQPATVSTITGTAVEVSNITQMATSDKDLAAINFDDDDETNLQAHAARNAMKAVDAAKERAQAFDNAVAEKLASTTPDDPEGGKEVTGIDIDRDDLNFQNPTMAGDIQVKQPKMLMAELKEYQLKGLNWLANLYEQGINGILADEMGLGKTVQSISLMAYLAEVHNIWGPFLVIAPASTLHNWQQEITRFVPALKALPYWGNVKDRTILRKFWNRKHLRYDRDAPFHVVITSYQLVVQDEKYFQTLKWQYMILDEAQAIKSSSSTRWKTLLGFQCRNRLLLTGTPIQNSMTELWALLHFIMPQLFDSHEEFSEWFSKDIENSVDRAGGMNEHQLRRLHLILKPFMLRRIKKNVQNELGDKIEIDVACGLTPRQKLMYSRLRENMSIADLVQKATSLSNDDVAVKRLMNLIMQFRKVCNHPELFERADVAAPLSLASFSCTANVARDGDLLDCPYSTRSMIQFTIPKTIYRQGGMVSVPGPMSRAGFDTAYLDHLLNIWSIPNIMAASPDQVSVPSWAKLLGFQIKDLHRAAQHPTPRRLPWLMSNRHQARQLALDASLEDSIAHQLQTTQIFSKSEILPRVFIQSDTPQLYEVLDTFRQSSRMNRADVQIFSETVVAPPVDFYCEDQAFLLQQRSLQFDPAVRLALFGLPPPAIDSLELSSRYQETFTSLPLQGIMGVSSQDQLPRSFMQVPQLEKLMLDSGKLARLDSLLQELKTGGHRVLIYFQMTRMIDLMEEYLSFRHYRYLRLDGSSTISERRDMVMDWQTRPELFIFLLSTRAGGLGINLTAADTVIFYDCDWNPSNDQQAMDRAHRLGQKRQVTVYRLITTGTIDERILKLARTKKTVQDAVVGSSSGNNPDSGVAEGAKPNEVVSLLLDEEELEAGLRAQAAKREAMKEKQVQGGLRGVRIREERKAALAATQRGSTGWGPDGLNLEEDEEEAFGFFATQAKRVDENGVVASVEAEERTLVSQIDQVEGKKKGKKRKPVTAVEKNGDAGKNGAKRAKARGSGKNRLKSEVGVQPDPMKE